MNRLLITGLVFVVAAANGSVHARETDLHGDVLVALLKNDSQARVQTQSHSAGDIPAPATYADRTLSLGGGGGGGGDVAAPTSTAPSASSESADEGQDEIQPATPAPRTSAWRALLPGSIQ